MSEGLENTVSRIQINTNTFQRDYLLVDIIYMTKINELVLK